MPPTQPKPEPKKEWRMPRPPAVILWCNAPGGETSYAIVTKYNRNSVSVIIFPPESRVGVPKDGVRYCDDPWNKTQGINADSGVWQYTEEHTLLQFAISQLVSKGVIEPEPSNSHLFARLAK